MRESSGKRAQIKPQRSPAAGVARALRSTCRMMNL